MELPGTSYLYTLATLSITYGGFAALIVVFRQIIGGGVSKFDVFLIRAVLLRSFIVTCSALLPPALVLFDLSHSNIWRISSIVAAVLVGWFVLMTHRIRREHLLLRGVSTSRLITTGVGAVTAIALVMNALGIFGKPAAGPFVIGVTAFLILSFYAYLAQLEVLLGGHVKQKGE